MQLKDNTWVKVSPTTKNYLCLEHNDKIINLRIFNQVKDIPYCDTFNTEENWIIASPDPNSERCIFRSTMQVIFRKSTLFKGKIETNAKNTTKTNFANYLKWVQAKAAEIPKNDEKSEEIS